MRYAALLRGVNVGGKMVAMSELRAMAESLGLADPKTLLQSGNLVFSSRLGAAKLQTLLETETKQRLGVDTRYLIRGADEWTALTSANPHGDAARDNPSRLAVVFFRDAPSASDVKALQASAVGREIIRVAGRHGYIIYPDGMGESKLTLAMIEKFLRTTGTARNWNTVGKIGALLAAD